MPKKSKEQFSEQNQNIVNNTVEPLVPLKKEHSQIVGELLTEKMPQLVMPKYHSLTDRVEKYYQEYQKIFLENQKLNDKLTEMIDHRNRLAEKYNSVKRIKVSEEAVKRKRRYARDIERLFHCPIDKCHRGYGSQGSLSHHVRLKHLEFYESGKYEIYIQKFIDEQQEGKKRLEEQEQQPESTPLKKVKLEDEEQVKKKEKKVRVKEEKVKQQQK